MFDFLNTGKLEKVKINGYEDINRGGAVKTFEAFINPDEFTVNYTSNFDGNSAAGQTGTPANFISTSPIELQLKFYLDGTNAAGKLKGSDGSDKTVAEKLIEFYEACGYNSSSHRPRYVEIIWGKLHLLRFDPECFNGCLKSVSVNYKLFNQDGTPLRAVITASFMEAIPDAERDSAGKTASPDMTHVRIVKEGDTLPSMSGKIYGDFIYYLEVAKANKLDAFRSLVPGTKIFFPPFDKNVKVKKQNA
jgi:hypothetical protein